MANMHCADLGNGYYRNPIIFGGYRDHTILKDGNDYYMAFGGGVGENVCMMHHSRDLVNWEPMYYVFHDVPYKLWAPDLVKINDVYYLYTYTGTEEPPWNHGKVLVTWTRDIKKGDWSELEVVRDNIPSIDPGHVVGEDGKRYLFMSQNAMFPLTEDGLRAAGSYRYAYPDWPIPDEFDIEGLATESPKLVWHNGWLYLTTAEGGTGGPSTAHMVISMRSRSVFGPWEMSPYNPIKHTASSRETWARKGHGTLIEGPDGIHWYLIYCGFLKGYRETTGKATLLEPVEWTEDGWWHVKDGCRDDEPIPMPEGGEKVPVSMELSTDFREGLPLLWMPAHIHTTDRLRFGSSGMTILGKGETPLESGVIFQKRESVNLEITAELTAEWHACAGICFGGINKIFGIAVEQDKIEIQCTGAPHWLTREHWVVNENANWFGNHIFLRLRNVENVVSAWYSSDGEKWKKLNICVDTSLGNYFSSVSPGIFCAKYGEATFHNYTVRRLPDGIFDTAEQED